MSFPFRMRVDVVRSLDPTEHPTRHFKQFYEFLAFRIVYYTH
jgi:hypothetical protein